MGKFHLGNKIGKSNPRDPLTAGRLEQPTPAVPLAGPKYVPDDHTTPQENKKHWSIRLLGQAHPKAWSGKKSPPSEPDPPPAPGTISSFQGPTDNVYHLAPVQTSLLDPAPDAQAVFEAGTSSGGEAFPGYESAEDVNVRVTANDPGRPQRHWDRQSPEHARAASGAAEVEGISAPGRQELPSGLLSDPPQELSASSPLRSIVPAPLVPPKSTKWGPDIRGKTWSDTPTDPPSTMPPSRPSTSPNMSARLVVLNNDGSEQAKAAAQTAARNANTGKRHQGPPYLPYRPPDGPGRAGAPAHRRPPGEVPPRQSSRDAIDTPVRSNQSPGPYMSNIAREPQAPPNGRLNGNTPGSGDFLADGVSDGITSNSINGTNIQHNISTTRSEQERKYEEQLETLDSLRHQLLSVQTDNDELAGELAHASDKYGRQRSEVQRLRADTDNLHTKLSSLRKNERTLSDSLGREQSRATRLEQEKAYFMHERDQAVKDKARLEGDSVQIRKNLEQQYLGDISTLTDGHDAEIRGVKVTYEDKISNLRAQLQSQEAGHKSQLQSQQEDYEGRLRSQEADYKLQLDTIEERTRAETASRISQLEGTVGALRAKIAEHSSSMHYKPLADSHFKRSLGALAQRITNLAASVPQPSDYAAAKPLDPTGFLGRNSQPRHWGQFVRHITWQMMIQGFFQYPLGFGAFGHEGEGQKDLYQFYRLFAHPDPGDPDGGLTLPNDTETNAGRAWFFGGILRDVKGSGAGDDSAEKYRRLFWANARGAEARLLATLQHMSGNRVEQKTRNQIPGLVGDFGLLSLEMASQRSHIMLEQCAHGKVAPSSKFKDNDGDPGAAGVVVDLMTQPSMIRIGDGQGELYAEVVLAQGDMVATAQGRRY